MTAPDPAPTDARRAEDRSARIAVTVFPLLVLAAALVGFLAPTAAKTLLPQVNLFLGIIMFGMGLTLTLPDFGLVARRPLPVLLGVVAQYAIMPLLGLAVALLLPLFWVAVHPGLLLVPIGGLLAIRPIRTVLRADDRRALIPVLRATGVIGIVYAITFTLGALL